MYCRWIKPEYSIVPPIAIPSPAVLKKQNALKFSDISFTELACDNMIVERSIVYNLPCIKSYEITDDSILVLKDDKGHILMELIRYDLPDESLCGNGNLKNTTASL